MKKSLKLLTMIASTALFVAGCTEERSVAPAQTSSPNESASGENSAREKSSNVSTTDADGSSTDNVGGNL